MAKEKNNQKDNRRFSRRKNLKNHFINLKFKIKNKMKGHQKISFQEFMKCPQEVLRISEKETSSEAYWITFDHNELKKDKKTLLKIRFGNDEKFIVSRISYYSKIFSIERCHEKRLTLEEMVKKYDFLEKSDGFVVEKNNFVSL